MCTILILVVICIVGIAPQKTFSTKRQQSPHLLSTIWSFISGICKISMVFARWTITELLNKYEFSLCKFIFIFYTIWWFLKFYWSCFNLELYFRNDTHIQIYIHFYKLYRRIRWIIRNDKQITYVINFTSSIWKSQKNKFVEDNIPHGFGIIVTRPIMWTWGKTELLS